MGIFSKLLSVFQKSVEGYCVGCRSNQQLTDIQYMPLKSGSKSHRRRSAICKVCGSKTSSYVPA
mgnify:CR=1 FL=1